MDRQTSVDKGIAEYITPYNWRHDYITQSISSCRVQRQEITVKSWVDGESFLEEAMGQYLDIVFTQQKQILISNGKKM